MRLLRSALASASPAAACSDRRDRRVGEGDRLNADDWQLTTAAHGHLLHNILLFGQLCRALGMHVTPACMIDVTRALEYIDLGKKWDVYHAMRALMVTNPRDFGLFDQAFRLFWKQPNDRAHGLDMRMIYTPADKRKPMQFLLPPTAEPDDSPGSQDAPRDNNWLALIPTYSTIESLRYKNFGEMSGAELAQAKAAIARLPHLIPLRRTRRHRSGKGVRVDQRRSLRRLLRYAGDPVELLTSTRRAKPRPVVLICDISGSMERYTRLLLHFMHALGNAAGTVRIESFVFSTRLTRITKPIRRRSVDAALSDVGTSVSDWGGGTKTGEALRTFNYRWSRRVLGRGALVLLITDGWDRGDPDLLRCQIDKLARSCHRLIWLNPLIGAPGYEPLTRGAQAMLPYVDDFLPVRNLANLETLVRVLSALTWQRSTKPGREASKSRGTIDRPSVGA